LEDNVRRSKLDLAIEFAELLFMKSQLECHINNCPQCARLNAEIIEIHNDLGDLAIHLKEVKRESNS